MSKSAAPAATAANCHHTSPNIRVSAVVVDNVVVEGGLGVVGSSGPNEIR